MITDSQGNKVEVGDRLYSSSSPTFVVVITDNKSGVLDLVESSSYGFKKPMRVCIPDLAHSNWVKYEPT